ncbi:MAG: protein arginine kinase [Clostridia bacterium]|nr:protein arginine kinase [Clostridia bacterium]
MAKWYIDDGSQSDVVLSTRIRLARNLKGFPFPNKMNADDAKRVIDTVEAALEEMNYTFTKIDLPAMTEEQRRKLVEERYISPAFASSKLPCAAYISEDENVSIMVNEEDHIRIQCIYAGFEDKKAYDLIEKVDGYLAERLDYAVHEKYGYLTSCLTNVGTGMRLSYMVRLPAIAMSGASESVFATIGKLGVTVRGMYGEGSKSTGHIFQLSNQTTLGRRESEIVSELGEIINNVISKERELREALFEKNGTALEDRIMRSWAILSNARILQSQEMIQRISDVSLGISLGIIKNIDSKDINAIMITASPAHIIANYETNEAVERDVIRARIVREAFQRR